MRRDAGQSEPISFGRAYAQSETFRTLFRDGMTLVEQTAAYLDGDGRAAAKMLTRPASIVYATESMRLTTRLMQLASWLLLHRSVNEGDLTIDQAAKEKRKIKMERRSGSADGPCWDQLPEAFRDLVDRSYGLQTRVERIDTAIMENRESEAEPTNPVAAHIDQLTAAFTRAS